MTWGETWFTSNILRCLVPNFQIPLQILRFWTNTNAITASIIYAPETEIRSTNLSTTSSNGEQKTDPTKFSSNFFSPLQNVIQASEKCSKKYSAKYCESNFSCLDLGTKCLYLSKPSKSSQIKNKTPCIQALILNLASSKRSYPALVSSTTSTLCFFSKFSQKMLTIGMAF